MISKDDGHSWLKEKVIILGDDAANWDCGYPSTIRLEGGELVTAYYSTPFPPEKADSWSCKGAKLHIVIYDEEELLKNI